MLARKKPAGSVIRIEVERRFEVSVREGFDYITEPANWPEYWPRFVRLDPASRWRDRGDRARLTLRMLGRDVELDMTLARREPCRVVEYTSEQRGIPAARHWRHFDDADGDLRLPHHHRVPVPSRMARRARPNARQGGDREKRACTSPSSMLTMATHPMFPAERAGCTAQQSARNERTFAAENRRYRLPGAYPEVLAPEGDVRMTHLSRPTGSPCNVRA